jgi:hypothetical protein
MMQGPDDLALTAGEAQGLRGDTPPHHEWPATVFIFLTRLSAWGLACGAVLYLAVAFASNGPDAWRRLAKAGGFAAGFLFQRTLAKNVQRFTHWGWYGAMAELAFVTLAKVNVLWGNPFAGGVTAVVGIAIDLLWMRHFWRRRGDFGVDIDPG